VVAFSVDEAVAAVPGVGILYHAIQPFVNSDIFGLFLTIDMEDAVKNGLCTLDQHCCRKQAHGLNSGRWRMLVERQQIVPTPHYP
jgi:hypothetical protein